MTDRKQDLRRDLELDHAFHHWINQRQDERREAGEPWEDDLYEWKNALRENVRLPQWLKQAREGRLPTIHQQCSHSAPEPIEANRLVCALGTDVTECPILKSVYASVAAEPDRLELTADDADVVAARVCTWHIFMRQVRGPKVDTSEGYVQDESDRQFWATTYRYMSMAEEEVLS